jgi:hypothetical protein
MKWARAFPAFLRHNLLVLVRAHALLLPARRLDVAAVQAALQRVVHAQYGTSAAGMSEASLLAVRKAAVAGLVAAARLEDATADEGEDGGATDADAAPRPAQPMSTWQRQCLLAVLADAAYQQLFTALSKSSVDQLSAVRAAVQRGVHVQLGMLGECCGCRARGCCT